MGQREAAESRKEAQVGLGPKCETVRGSFSQEMRDSLTGLDPWFAHIIDFRDAFAHRIPLYIPPYIVSEQNEAEYAALEVRKRATKDNHEYDRLSAEQQRLEEFHPVMKHALDDNKPPVVFHFQLVNDFLTGTRSRSRCSRSWRVRGLSPFRQAIYANRPGREAIADNHKGSDLTARSPERSFGCLPGARRRFRIMYVPFVFEPSRWRVLPLSNPVSADTGNRSRVVRKRLGPLRPPASSAFVSSARLGVMPRPALSLVSSIELTRRYGKRLFFAH
jgi:hypothetical protein